MFNNALIARLDAPFAWDLHNALLVDLDLR